MISNAGAIMAAGGDGGGWEKTFEQSFKAAAFLGHSLKNYGPIVVDGVTYTGLHTGDANLSDMVYTASGLESQFSGAISGSPPEVSFALDATVIGADPISPTTRLALQAFFAVPPSTSGQAQYFGMGPSGLPLYAGIRANVASGGKPVRALGATGVGDAQDSATTVAGVNYMDFIVSPWDQSGSLWYATGAPSLTFAEPGSVGTYFDAVCTTRRNPVVSVPRPRSWSALLGSLLAGISTINKAAGAWTSVIEGFAVWRIEA